MVVEYAKAAPDDILMLVTAHNRGPDAATLHLLPTLWFRNTWSWGDDVAKPTLEAPTAAGRRRRRAPSHPELGDWLLRADASAQLLFCENETNNERLFGAPNASPHVKDAINDFVVGGRRRRGQPGPHGHQGRRPPRAGDRGRARARRSACA